MGGSTFERLVDEFLLPMLPGTSRAAGITIHARKRQVVSYAKAGGGNQLLVRPEALATVEYTLSRSQKFQASELALATSFVEGAQEIESGLGKAYEAEVLRGLPLRVVARAAGGKHHQVLLQILEQFAAWAAEQYEGRPVVSAAGIDPSVTGHVDVAKLWKESFAPVLSNGMDTLVVVDPAARVASLKAVDSTLVATYSPVRYAHVAGWSSSGKIAAALNRNGEILVFTDGVMRFALRRGHWHHFTHSAIVSSIHLPRRKEAKNAIYETLLDVAFARCGGCIAVVDRANAAQVTSVVAAKDLIQPAAPALPSLKAELLAKAVGTGFADLDRRIRAELVAMDGATIISHQGKILAAGAIVKIGAGSSGGGRLAATKALAKLGFAAKISQDGGVTGYDAAGRTAAEPDDDWMPSFEFG
jgi:hypothetical protein